MAWRTRSSDASKSPREMINVQTQKAYLLAPVMLTARTEKTEISISHFLTSSLGHSDAGGLETGKQQGQDRNSLVEKLVSS